MSEKRVALLVENMVEDVEFQIPFNALKEAGAEIVVLGSRMNEKYKGKKGTLSVAPDATTTDARASEFDAVIIPGGIAPDRMRTNMKTVRFVHDAMSEGKLVAAICHGPQVLIEGDLLQGKHATGFRAIRKDMQNAGALFENKPLVMGGNLITSRRPGDLAIFTTAILNYLGLSAKQSLPDVNDPLAEWWKLAETWGGSSKQEIVTAINTGLRGERYAVTAFEHYAENTEDAELGATFREIARDKQHHILMLQERLAELGEKETLQGEGSGALATLKSWLQSSSDIALLRRALGDLQTGVVDAFNLSVQLTDPRTDAIFDEIEIDLAKDEQRIAELYHVREPRRARPASPSTGVGVSA